MSASRARRSGGLKRGAHPASADDSGSALVEFALILPLFALMLFAVIQFGLVFAGWASLRNSVQTSGRMLSIDTTGTDSTCNAITDENVPGGSSYLTTRRAICEVETEIGTPIGTSSTTLPQVAIVVSDSNTLTVCVQVLAQPYTGFFPSMSLTSKSQFYIDDQDLTPIQTYVPAGMSCTSD